MLGWKCNGQCLRARGWLVSSVYTSLLLSLHNQPHIKICYTVKSSVVDPADPDRYPIPSTCIFGVFRENLSKLLKIITHLPLMRKHWVQKLWINLKEIPNFPTCVKTGGRIRMWIDIVLMPIRMRIGSGWHQTDADPQHWEKTTFPVLHPSLIPCGYQHLRANTQGQKLLNRHNNDRMNINWTEKPSLDF